MSTGTASTVQPVKRPASDQVWAWRHNFYDFRKARRLVEKNKPAEALPYLEGAHANYVRARFRAIGRHDPRFIAVLALCNAADTAAPREPIPPTNQDSVDAYGRDLEHFANELTARRKVTGANGYHYLLTRDSSGREQIERTTPNHATTSIVKGNAGGLFASTNAAIAWAMDNQKRDPFPAEPQPITPPTNQAEPAPMLHVSPDIAKAFGMADLPNVVVEPAASPVITPRGKVIVDVRQFRDALRSMRRQIPIITKIEKGMVDGNGRKVTAIVGARRVRFESDGDNVLRVSALDYPAIAPIELDRVHVDAFAFWAIDVETLCQIFELSIDQTMSLAVEGGELHIRGSDSHYKLFHEDPADAYRFALPEAKLTPSQWLARALELAATVTKDDAEAQRAVDAHLRPVTPAMRRKFAWAILKAKSAADEAYRARLALLESLGTEKLSKWLTTVLGTPVTPT